MKMKEAIIGQNSIQLNYLFVCVIPQQAQSPILKQTRAKKQNKTHTQKQT
jgi:hypothetical protein